MPDQNNLYSYPVLNNITGAFPLLLVISGPSGVGKDSAISELCKQDSGFHYIVTATTRPKRPGEIDGENYHFVSKEKFDGMVAGGNLLEWAKVYDNYYGVPRDPVKKALQKYKIVIIKVDVQGAITLKKAVPEAIFIFLMPPSERELINRITNRGHIADSDLKLRLSKVREEIEQLDMFDYVVDNNKDALDITIMKIKAIIVAESCKTKPRIITL